MKTYFESAHSNGGMVCEGEITVDKVFNKIQEIHKKSFRDIDGEYIKRDEEEKICVIRLPPTVFFKVLLRLGSALMLRCRRRLVNFGAKCVGKLLLMYAWDTR